MLEDNFYGLTFIYCYLNLVWLLDVCLQSLWLTIFYVYDHSFCWRVFSFFAGKLIGFNFQPVEELPINYLVFQERVDNPTRLQCDRPGESEGSTWGHTSSQVNIYSRSNPMRTLDGWPLSSFPFEMVGDNFWKLYLFQTLFARWMSTNQ